MISFYAGVILKPNVSHMTVSTEKSTTFTAQLNPALAGQGTVSFKLYRSDRKDPMTRGPDFPNFFRTPGRYL